MSKSSSGWWRWQLAKCGWYNTMWVTPFLRITTRCFHLGSWTVACCSRGQSWVVISTYLGVGWGWRGLMTLKSGLVVEVWPSISAEKRAASYTTNNPLLKSRLKNARSDDGRRLVEDCWSNGAISARDIAHQYVPAPAGWSTSENITSKNACENACDELSSITSSYCSR